MKNANTTWTIKSFEEDGSTTVLSGVSRGDALREIYRAMGAWYPERAPQAEPAERADAPEREKIAA
jgi:hypothetical protein